MLGLGLGRRSIGSNVGAMRERLDNGVAVNALMTMDFGEEVENPLSLISVESRTMLVLV